jgi:hypothetical protein
LTAPGIVRAVAGKQFQQYAEQESTHHVNPKRGQGYYSRRWHGHADHVTQTGAGGAAGSNDSDVGPGLVCDHQSHTLLVPAQQRC